MEITLKLALDSIPKRATAIVIYREGEALVDTHLLGYNKVKEIQLSGGAGWSEETINGRLHYSNTIIDEMFSEGSYNFLNGGISENLLSTYLNYSMSTVVNDYLFVSDFSNGNIERGEYSIARSLNGRYSVFNWADGDTLQFSNPINALAGFNGKLYVFTSKEIVRVDPENLIIEDELKGFSCGNKDGVIVNEYGMFFGDKSHAYHHDGSNVKVLSFPIETDEFSGNSNSWQDKITDTNFKASFSSKSNLVMFVFEKTAPSATEAGVSGMFSYHVLKQRWDYKEFLVERNGFLYSQPVANQFLVESKLDDKIYYFSGPSSGVEGATLSTLVSELAGGDSNGYFSWTSKDMTMDTDVVEKRFVKLKIEASKALSITPTVYIDDSIVTLNSSGTNEWRINKRGKKIRFKLSSESDNVTPTNEGIIIYSIGIIYRPTKVK